MSAYIDNALSDEDRQNLEARLRVDPVLALNLENLRQTDALLLAAFDAPMKQRVPKRFFDLLGPPTLKSLPDQNVNAQPARAANDNGAPWWCVSPKIARAFQWARGNNRQ